MSAAPETALGRRSIEDILLEHGHVTKEQVDAVTAAELEPGRPLGQILVEAGTITRLQLASALAEQWSDSGAPIAPPDGLSLSGFPALAPRPGPAIPDQSELVSRLRLVEETLEKLNASDDEDESAAFQAAVAGVSERLSNAEPAIEELGRRLEALAADASRDGRVEELFAVVGELHDRVGSVGRAVDVASRQSEQLTADAATEIEHVRADLTALTARLPELAQGQEAHVEQVENLRALVDDLSQRPAGDPALAARIEDLKAVVQALTERPSSDPVLVAQVDTVALRLAEVGNRVDVLSAAVQSTSGDDEALQELKSALGELAQRPLADPAADRRVEELAALVEELAQRTHADPAADARIDELARVLEELAQRPLTDPAAEQRLDALATALDELRSSMVALVARPAGDPALDEKLFELTARLEELERADVLEELRSRLAELAERPAGDPALADRLAELESKIDALPATDVLAELGEGDRALDDRIDGVVARVDKVAGAIEELAGSQIPHELWNEATTAINARIDSEKDLDVRLTGLEVRLAQIGKNGASPPAPADPKLGAQIAALNARVEQLAAGVAGAPPAAEGSDAAPAVSPTGATPATLERDVEHVLMAIERLSVHLGAHERALTELMGASGIVAQVRELGARVGDLETYGTGSSGGSGDGSEGGGDGREMRAELRSLMRRLDDAETSQKNDRDRVVEQLERAAGAIDWRLQRLEAVQGDEPST